MSNKLIPFDAATFDPKKYRLKWGNEYVRFINLHNGLVWYIRVEYKDRSLLFDRSGRHVLNEPVTLFMEPIELEGEEEEHCESFKRMYTALEKERDEFQEAFNKHVKRGDQYKAERDNLERELKEVKEDRDEWKECNSEEAKNSDNWRTKFVQVEKERDELKEERDQLKADLENEKSAWLNVIEWAQSGTGRNVLKGGDFIPRKILEFLNEYADIKTPSPVPPATIPFSWSNDMDAAPRNVNIWVVGIDANGDVRKIHYTSYHPECQAYREGERESWWEYISDRNACHKFKPVAWISLPLTESVK